MDLFESWRVLQFLVESVQVVSARSGDRLSGRQTTGRHNVGVGSASVLDLEIVRLCFAAQLIEFDPAYLSSNV